MRRSAVKENLRAVALEARRALAFEEVYRLSALVQKRFLSSVFYSQARRISLYSSFQNEVLTDEIFKRAATDGKEVCYPRVVRGKERHLDFFKVTSQGDLSIGSYEIKEPARGAHKVDPLQLDLVVVPGAAFDASGGRLGYGKGYYDRALSGLSCPIVGLAYEFQILKEDMPLEVFDVGLSALVTEKRLLMFRQQT